jgi:hypothetical protein
MKKQRWFAVAIILVLVIGIGSFFAIRYFSNRLGDATTYVSVEVTNNSNGTGVFAFKPNNLIAEGETSNALFEFTVDSNNKVVSVVSFNDEADALLENVDFIGMDIVDATEKLTELCIEAGYINVDNDETTADDNELIITVVSADEETQTEVNENIKERIEDYFLNNGIFGKVSQEVLDEYLDEAAAYDLSVGHVKLIMRALDANRALTFEEVKDLPIRDIMAIIKNEHNNLRKVASEIKDQLKIDLQNLRNSEKYAEMFNAIDNIDTLQKSLYSDVLTDEERAAIQLQIDEAKENFETQYADLLNEYKSERDALIDQAREDSEQILEDLKDQFNSKREQNKNKLNELKQRLNELNGDLLERIRNWRNGDQQ